MEQEAAPKEIQFEKNNPYLNADSSMKTAKSLIDNNKSQEAIICLQAEV